MLQAPKKPNPLNIIRELLTIGETLEATLELNQKHADFLREHKELLKESDFIQDATKKLLSKLEKPITTIDEALRLELSLKRANQANFFIKHLITTLNALNLDHWYLLYYLLEDLCKLISLFSHQLLKIHHPLHTDPLFVRQSKYKSALEKTHMVFRLHNAYLMANEHFFHPPTISALKQKKETLTALLFSTEVLHLELETHIQHTDGTNGRANAIYCLSTFYQLSEKQTNTCTEKDKEILSRVQKTLESVSTLQLPSSATTLCLQRAQFEEALAKITVRALMHHCLPSSQVARQMLEDISQIQVSLANYASLEEDSKHSLISQFFAITQKFDRVRQKNELIILLNALYKLLDNWISQLKIDQTPCNIALGLQLFWMSHCCRETSVFIQNSHEVPPPTITIEVSHLAHRLDKLNLNKTQAFEVYSATQQVMAFSTHLLPNSHSVEIERFLKGFQKVVEYPEAINQLIDLTIYRFRNKTCLDSLSHPPAVNAYSQQRELFLAYLTRINILSFVLTHFATPLDIRTSSHHQLLYLLAEDLCLCLNSYTTYYLQDDIPVNERDHIFRLLPLYKLVLDKVASFFKCLADHALQNKDFIPSICNEFKKQRILFFEIALKINCDLIDISMKRNQLENVDNCRFAFEKLMAEVEEDEKLAASMATLPALKTRFTSLVVNLRSLDKETFRLFTYLHLQTKTLRKSLWLHQSLQTECLTTWEMKYSLQLTKTKAILCKLNEVKDVQDEKECLAGMRAIIGKTFQLLFRLNDCKEIVEEHLKKSAEVCDCIVSLLKKNGHFILLNEMAKIFADYATFCNHVILLHKRKSNTNVKEIIIPHNIPPASAIPVIASDTTPNTPSRAEKETKQTPADKKKETPKEKKKEATLTAKRKKYRLKPDKVHATTETSTASTTPNGIDDTVEKKPENAAGKIEKAQSPKVAPSGVDAVKPLPPLAKPIAKPVVPPKEAAIPSSAYTSPKMVASSSGRKKFSNSQYKNKASPHHRLKPPSSRQEEEITRRNLQPVSQGNLPLVNLLPPMMSRWNNKNPLAAQIEESNGELKDFSPVKGITLPIPPVVQFLLKKIHETGCFAYIFGGFIRNSLLNKPFYDIDIITNCKNEMLVSLLNKGAPNPFNNNLFELIHEGIRFDIVTAEVPLKTFLRQRDITINAMLCTHDGKVFDLLNVFDDISLKHLKTLEFMEKNPYVFASNILRLIRFSTYLDKTLLSPTISLMHSHGDLLTQLPFGILIRQLERLLTAGFAEKNLKLLIEHHLFSYLFPRKLRLEAKRMIFPAEVRDVFVSMDKLSLEEREQKFTVFHGIALLLVSLLTAKNPDKEHLEASIQELLEQFCQYNANEAFDPTKQRFIKTTAPLLKYYYGELVMDIFEKKPALIFWYKTEAPMMKPPLNLQKNLANNTTSNPSSPTP